MGRSRNYRTGCTIRKPVAPPMKVMKIKKDYKRDKHTEFQEIVKGLEEYLIKKEKGEFKNE